MNAQECLNFLRGILQPSTVSQLALNGTIDSYKKIEEVLNILEKEISPKKGLEP